MNFVFLVIDHGVNDWTHFENMHSGKARSLDRSVRLFLNFIYESISLLVNICFILFPHSRDFGKKSLVDKFQHVRMILDWTLLICTILAINRLSGSGSNRFIILRLKFTKFWMMRRFSDVSMSLWVIGRKKKTGVFALTFSHTFSFQRFFYRASLFPRAKLNIAFLQVNFTKTML